MPLSVRSVYLGLDNMFRKILTLLSKYTKSYPETLTDCSHLQMHGYEPGYGPPPPQDLYAPGPGPHSDLPLLPGPGLGPHGHLDPMSGPPGGYHDLGGPHPMEHGGPLPPHGEDFSSAFGEPGDCGQTIEGKV